MIVMVAAIDAIVKRLDFAIGHHLVAETAVNVVAMTVGVAQTGIDFGRRDSSLADTIAMVL